MKPHQYKDVRVLEFYADRWRKDDAGCFVWMGGVFQNTKRPRVSMCGKYYRVSRLICDEFHGPAPFAGAEACHKPPCKNISCINPEHLYWGTHSQNEHDKPPEVRKSAALVANIAQHGPVTVFGEPMGAER